MEDEQAHLEDHHDHHNCYDAVNDQDTSREHIFGQTAGSGGATIQKVCMHEYGHTCTFEYYTWLNNVGQLKDCKNINSYQDQKSCQDNLEPLLMVQHVELYWLKSNLLIK